jgi:hypothetical protein
VPRFKAFADVHTHPLPVPSVSNRDYGRKASDWMMADIERIWDFAQY